MTIIIRVDPKKPSRERIRDAAKIIREGGLVAFPTETVYGLGADALNESAVRKIFEVKQRPMDDPIIVHISRDNTLQLLAAEVPEVTFKLVKKFWPGPLTLVLKKSKIVPAVVTAGLDTVAVRMPSNKIAHMLIEEADVPIAAPSANLFGKPSPTTAEHVRQDLYGKIDMIIDGGQTEIGVESTVLDLTVSPPMILRPGGVTHEELESILGEVKLHPSVRRRKKVLEVVKSPGMKYRHYSPKADVILVEGKSGEDIERKVAKLVDEYRREGKRVGLLNLVKEMKIEADVCIFLGNSPEEVARNLFSSLREMDEKKVDLIVVGGIEEKGLGLAIMNRLRKASVRIV
ncbi:threonylcarbamoyl-AMP synthase [Candidatus Bathyarchaeota archaeon ex4484_205]|nr:MAG: threonylcarbamoyl-AMP synthase [Candidatus Bathyarchaeota archaeon ex4484_205]RLG67937.1 MAG: threonylcarbamoyl-AMP synthase [archaeon]